MHPLENPAHSALFGPHRPLAQIRGQAARYPAAMSPFVALPSQPDAQAWQDLAVLCGPGAQPVTAGLTVAPPAGWEVVFALPGLQLVDEHVDAKLDPDAEVLGVADVPEMLELVRRTEPGPFLARTIELGTYLGIRHDSQLIAMAGERMRPPGWSEISAVCSDPAWRGRGLASRLVRSMAAVIRDRGETPFLHVAGSNSTAIRLYESLGFARARETTFRAVRVPPGW